MTWRELPGVSDPDSRPGAGRSQPSGGAYHRSESEDNSFEILGAQAIIWDTAGHRVGERGRIPSLQRKQSPISKGN